MKLRIGVAIVLLVWAHASPAASQVDERLAAYTGRNSKGYLSPLVDAYRSNLNSGLFHSARVPIGGFHVSLELNGMATFFDESSRSFTAVTEGDFLPTQSAVAPTVVGNNDAVFVEGVAGTQFAFPGGFNVDHMWYACPQLRIGSWRGTEAMGRLILYDAGISELGETTVWGVGFRHSISQYLASVRPVDLAVAVTYQDTRLEDENGQDVLKSDIFTTSLHSSVDLGAMCPYAGLSVNWFDMGLEYVFEEETGLDPFRLDFEYDAELQLTLGIAYRMGGLAVYGEYNWADQSSLATGLSVTYPFNNRSATP
jgi:hypothetical protein